MLSVLDGRVKLDRAALAELDRQVHGTRGITLRHEDAVPPPLSPLEAAALATTKSLDAAKDEFIASCGRDTLESCVNLDWFNTWGYNLLGQHRAGDALTVFQLNAWAHPRIANTQDSLADAFAAVGDNENAKKAVERAIALTPIDTSLDSAAKLSFLSEETAKLKRFK